MLIYCCMHIHFIETSKRYFFRKLFDVDLLSFYAFTLYIVFYLAKNDETNIDLKHDYFVTF